MTVREEQTAEPAGEPRRPLRPDWPKPEEIIARLGPPPKGRGADHRFELIAAPGLVLDDPTRALVEEAFTKHEGFPMDSFTPLVTEMGRVIGNARLVRVRPDDRIRFGLPRGAHDVPASYVRIAVDREAEPTSVLSLTVHTHYQPGSGSEMPLWGVILQVALGELPRQHPCGITSFPGDTYLRSLRTFWEQWAYAGDQVECDKPLIEQCPWSQRRG